VPALGKDSYVLHLEKADVAAVVASMLPLRDVAAAWPKIGPALSAELAVRTEKWSVEVTDTFMDGLYRVRDAYRRSIRNRSLATAAPATPVLPTATPAGDAGSPVSTDAPWWLACLPCSLDVTVDLGALAAAYRTADSAAMVTVAAVTLGPSSSENVESAVAWTAPRAGSTGADALRLVQRTTARAKKPVVDPGAASPPAPLVAYAWQCWGSRPVVVTSAVLSVLDVAADRTVARTRSGSAERRTDHRAQTPSFSSLERTRLLELDRVVVQPACPQVLTVHVGHADLGWNLAAHYLLANVRGQARTNDDKDVAHDINDRNLLACCTADGGRGASAMVGGPRRCS